MCVRDGQARIGGRFASSRQIQPADAESRQVKAPHLSSIIFTMMVRALRLIVACQLLAGVLSQGIAYLSEPGTATIEAGLYQCRVFVSHYLSHFFSGTESFWLRSLGAFLPTDGNAVVLSPDESRLYVTTSGGRFFVLEPSSGNILAPAITPPIAGIDWSIESNSGVAVNGDLAVFGVVDLPPDDDFTSRKQTRIVAVDGASASILWASDQMEGEIAGTPVLSLDGQRIMFTRNSIPPPDPPTSVPTVPPTPTPTSAPTTASPTASPTTLPPTETPVASESTNSTNRNLQAQRDTRVTGYFTVLNAATGEVLLNQPSPDLLATHLYSPVGIAHNVSSPRFQGAVVGADLVVWHTSSSVDGGAETQLYQYITNTTAVGTTFQLASSDWVTATAPAIAERSGSLFIGASDGTIQGWTGDRSFNLVPNFSANLDGFVPSSQAVFTQDETALLISTSDNAFQAVDVETESLRWFVPSTDGDPILTRGVPSPDGKRVYIAAGSRLYGLDMNDGSTLWGPLENRDGTPVQADFTVSADGRFIYYVGFRENMVTALKVADLIPIVPTAPPTQSPTLSPTTSSAPTGQVTPAPSPAPVVPAPTLSPTATTTTTTRSRNFPFILAGSIGGGVLLLGLCVIGVLWFMRGRGGGSGEGIELNYDFNSAPRPSEPTSGQEPAIQRPKRYSYDPTRV